MAAREATIEDLYRVDGKAELVGGELVLMSPTGGIPGFAGGEIFASLREYGRRTKAGYALPDNVGFLVRLPSRRSFSPDAAFTTQAPLTGKFIDGAPVFAAEVRSEDDDGPAAERAMAAKRADYFAAGTMVVWDVDVLREQLNRSSTGIDHPGSAGSASAISPRRRSVDVTVYPVVSADPYMLR